MIAQSARLFDQPMPHSAPAEAALLGSMILNPGCIPEVRAKASAHDFYLAAHGTIYNALLDAYDATGGLDVDLVLLRDRLDRSAVLADVGGPDYLARLAEEVPSGVNWPHYLRIVREHAASRRLVQTTGEAMHRAMHDADPSEVAAWLETGLNAVRDGRDEPGEFTGEQALDAGIADLRAGRSGFYPTGLLSLDEKCGGIPEGGVTTILGASGAGKSSLVCAILKHFIFELGLGVGVFSNEVNATQYMLNVVMQASGIPISRIKRLGKPLSATDNYELAGWSDKLRERTVMLCQDALGPAGIFARCGAWKRRGVQVVVVDYIQNLPREGRDSEYELVGDAMNTMRRIVNEHGLTVIAVSQPIVSASRTAEPLRMSDCRGSSAIEEVTDMGFSVWRGCTGRTQGRDETDDQWEDAKRRMEIHVCKNKRLGMVGMVPAEFDPVTTRIMA